MSYNQQTFNSVRDYLRNTVDRVSFGSTPFLQANVLTNSPKDSYNEVYPGILIGDETWVQNKPKLKGLGITHVVNCAQGNGKNQVNTDFGFYNNIGIHFHGIDANDISAYDMTPQFSAAAAFIDQALADNGKVFVHCKRGVSRSATIVLAFLMLKRDMTLLEAVKTVKQHRNVFPISTFLRQLSVLDKTLSEERIHSCISHSH